MDPFVLIQLLNLQILRSIISDEDEEDEDEEEPKVSILSIVLDGGIR